MAIGDNVYDEDKLAEMYLYRWHLIDNSMAGCVDVFTDEGNYMFTTTCEWRAKMIIDKITGLNAIEKQVS